MQTICIRINIEYVIQTKTRFSKKKKKEKSPENHL